MTEGRIKGSKIRGSVQDGRFVPNSQQHTSDSKASQIYLFSRLISHEKDSDFVGAVDLDVVADFDGKQFPKQGTFFSLSSVNFCIPTIKECFLAKLSKGYSACT